MTVLQRIDVDRISEQAHEARIGRSVLTVILSVFFAVGWSAAIVALAVKFCAVAVREGWREGMKAAQESENIGPARTG